MQQPAHPGSYGFPDIGYVLTCECGSRAFNIVLSNENLDSKNDVIGFVCLKCGDSMSFDKQDRGSVH
jgi:hypothetical protein